MFVPVLTLGLYLGLAQDASARCCTLKSGASPNANSIASLYDIIFVLAVIVFLVTRMAPRRRLTMAAAS